jgi:hypothetical protein
MFAVLLFCSSVIVGETFTQPYLDDTPDGPTYTDPVVYAVYSAAINSILKRSYYQPDPKIYIFDRRATGQGICGTPNKAHEAVLAPAIASYAKANTVARSLLPRFTLEKPYEAVPQTPRGDTGIYLSSIGFNRHKTVAILSAMAKGGGSNYVLIKKSGKWQLLEGWSDTACVWAS